MRCHSLQEGGFAFNWKPQISKCFSKTQTQLPSDSYLNCDELVSAIELTYKPLLKPSSYLSHNFLVSNGVVYFYFYAHNFLFHLKLSV